MGQALGTGEASRAGLRWLARVGPAPLDAWCVALGWAQVTGYKHAQRLVAEGSCERQAMRRGQGTLWWATKAGLAEVGLQEKALAMAIAPAPTTWAHYVACAWTAAWLSARGRLVHGTRELLVDKIWRGELQWLERDGVRRRGHRPDLAAGLSDGRPLVPVEVELQTKSARRLGAILALHAGWIAAGKTSAVIYVCGSELTAERVRRAGGEAGLAVKAGTGVRKTLRIELLADVRAGAIAARSTALDLASTK